MKKNNQGFIQIIIILVVIALVGGGMYYFGNLKNKSSVVVETPTSIPAPSETSVKEETANWKTYTNDQYGFSFKYPSDWKKIESLGSIKFVTFSDMDRDIFITHHKNVSDVAKWYLDNQAGTINSYKTINSLKIAIASGGTQLVSREYAFVSSSGSLFRFVVEPVSMDSSVIAEVDKTFDQILSTFKFTK